MTERQALLGAGTLHILLFAALSVGWSLMKQPQQIEEAVAVEFVDVAPETRVTERPEPSKAAAPQETAAPEPQPEVAEPEPTPPAPVPDAVPIPDPKPVEKPKPEAKPVEKPKPAKPKPVKAEPRPQRLDTAELSSLIDKALPKAPKRVRDPSDFAKSIELSIPKSARLDARATASLAAAIHAQIAPCWNPPIGGTDIKKMTVVLGIQLGRDGSVIGRPTVLGRTGGTGNPGYAKAFEDTAVRAVLRCAPLKLPADMFEAWKAFELNFDPSEMT